jgi:hypothetical protein
MAAKILHNDYPHRSVALVTASHTLIFHHSASSTSIGGSASTSSSNLVDRDGFRPAHQCAVGFAATSSWNIDGYTVLSSQPCLGCLGLISIGRDTFLCVITGAKEVAQVRPGELVYRIYAVEFRT